MQYSRGAVVLPLFLILGLFLAAPLAFAQVDPCSEPNPIRAVAPGIGPEILTHIPSAAGGTEGIAARIIPPTDARYGDGGAPVAVLVAGGVTANNILNGGGELAPEGFIEIHFNYPGGGTGDYASGGTYDDRGPNCLRAVCDVARFAMGLEPDVDGNYLGDLVAPIVPQGFNTGFLALSNGGNGAITTAGLHGDELFPLAWIMDWESPVGDGMPTAEAGAKGGTPLRNPAYDPDTGTWELSRLKYSAAIDVNTNHTSTYPDPVYGGLYFDFDGDNTFSAGDFQPGPFMVMETKGIRAYYSERLTIAAEAKGLYPDPAPPHLTTSSEAEAFWLYRNGAYWFDEAVAHLPHLLFMVEAGDQDHVQTALDHPHVLIQYTGFLDAGARFARLNPDRDYVEEIMGIAVPAAVDNDAFAEFDHISIRLAVEPRGVGGVPASVGHTAGACELADRTWTHTLDTQVSPSHVSDGQRLDTMAETLMGAFSEADTNGDDGLSESESLTVIPAMQTASFNAMDSDSNGVLSMDELLAAAGLDGSLPMGRTAIVAALVLGAALAFAVCQRKTSTTAGA